MSGPYSRPVQTTRLAITSNATAGNLTTTTLIAALGNAISARLAWINIAFLYDVTPGAVLYCRVGDTAGLDAADLTISSIMPSIVFVWTYPGMLMSSNTAVTVGHQCSIAHQDFRVTVGWYQDFNN